jgi:hypothetical protein
MHGCWVSEIKSLLPSAGCSTSLRQLLGVDRSHGIRQCNLARRTPPGRDLSQPEIENLGVPRLGYKDVRGLDVAVNDPLCVRGIDHKDVWPSGRFTLRMRHSQSTNGG